MWSARGSVYSSHVAHAISENGRKVREKREPQISEKKGMISKQKCSWHDMFENPYRNDNSGYGL